MTKGEIQIMSAGNGIIHTDIIDHPTNFRLLQMWLTLPKSYRWMDPELHILKANQVPYIFGGGVNIKVYSGQFAGLISPIQNKIPLTIAEFNMEPETLTIEELPNNLNTFIYVTDGAINIQGKKLVKDQIGWLNFPNRDSIGQNEIINADQQSRFFLYAGEPTNDPIVSYGPFIANDSKELSDLYNQYNRGSMPLISDLPKDKIFNYHTK